MFGVLAGKSKPGASILSVRGFVEFRCSGRRKGPLELKRKGFQEEDTNVKPAFKHRQKLFIKLKSKAMTTAVFSDFEDNEMR
jgi:hypothetical protein